MRHNPPVTSPVSTPDIKRDTALVAAVDEARAAVVEEAGPDMVGEHLGVVMEAERLATHMFACLNPAYVGWQWAVTVARAPRAKAVTISEVVLLPGPEALVAPAWLPWSERVRPGDLAPGDVLPTPVVDPRLVPGYTGADDLDALSSSSPLQPGAWEIGLGRERVLSLIGRDDAADRWSEGEFGPSAAMAKHASLDCATCGFLLPMGGPMGQLFAVCANEMSPADGRVVTLTYGCGAHSEVMVAPPEIPTAIEVIAAEDDGDDGVAVEDLTTVDVLADESTGDDVAVESTGDDAVDESTEDATTQDVVEDAQA